MKQKKRHPNPLPRRVRGKEFRGDGKSKGLIKGNSFPLYSLLYYSVYDCIEKIYNIAQLMDGSDSL